MPTDTQTLAVEAPFRNPGLQEARRREFVQSGCHTLLSAARPIPFSTGLVGASRMTHCCTIYSAVNSFIKDDAFAQYLMQEGVTQSQPVLQIGGSAHQQVEGEMIVNCPANLHGLLRFPQRRLHDHEDVHIAGWSRGAVGVGSKQDDAEWSKLVDDLLHNPGERGDTGQHLLLAQACRLKGDG